MSLVSQIESLLYVSNRPLSVAKLSELTGATEPQVQEALAAFAHTLNSAERGIVLMQQEDRVQIATAGTHAEVIAKYLREEFIGEMTKPQLETLTIIAYRGPISKGELEQIRGVNCGLILRNLMIRGLVEEIGQEGRRDAMVSVLRRFQVTFEFLKHLGLRRAEELPEYAALSRHEFIDEILKKDETPIHASIHERGTHEP